MGETLKDDLRHLEHLRQNAHATHGKQQGRRVRWLQYHSKLQAMFERGDLIPRDEITPQMAAEVLLKHERKIVEAAAFAKHSHACDGGHALVGHAAAQAAFYAMRHALTAIKESKDE